MAERIVSPGVFTRERDLSFLPQAIGEIGAAIIGPTKRGPAFTPTAITSFQEFEEVFGEVDSKFYTPYTVEQYLQSAGVVTVVRVVGIGGYKQDALRLVAYSSDPTEVTIPTSSIAILAPSRGSDGAGDFSKSAISGSGTGSWSEFILNVSGSNIHPHEQYTLSFNTGSANFIDKVLSSDAQSTKMGDNTSSVYVYKIFKNRAMNLGPVASRSLMETRAIVSADGLEFQGGSTAFDSNGNAQTWTGNKDYQFARTPMLQSQLVAGSRYPLFRVYSRSHGTNINTTYKIKVLNVKPADDVVGSDFGTFSIQVVLVSDNTILEQYDALTLDPASPNYFAKKIGDRWSDIDDNGKITFYGNYPNISKYIRVGDFNDMEVDGVFKHPKDVVPMGHKALNNTTPGGTSIAAVVTASAQTDANGTFDSSVAYGIDLNTKYARFNTSSFRSIYW